MTTKSIKKAWTEQEKEYLSIGHNLGASLKTLSVVLNRTESALSKALLRLGIRQYGSTARGQKPKSRYMNTLTPEKLLQEIKELAKSKEYSLIFSNHLDLSKPSEDFSSLSHFPNPFLNFPKRIKSLPSPVWLDLDSVIIILKNRGHTVCRYSRYRSHTRTTQGIKPDFLLDGLPITAAQLLIRANRIRLEQGLEPFYVENITED
jgi:hypothetical protein